MKVWTLLRTKTMQGLYLTRVISSHWLKKKFRSGRKRASVKVRTKRKKSACPWRTMATWHTWPRCISERLRKRSGRSSIQGPATHGLSIRKPWKLMVVLMLSTPIQIQNPPHVRKLIRKRILVLGREVYRDISIQTRWESALQGKLNLSLKINNLETLKNKKPFSTEASKPSSVSHTQL